MSAIASLFQEAARLAAVFRQAAPARHMPTHDYAASLACFDEPLPAAGSDMLDVIRRLSDGAEPGLHATTGPRFFGWVIGGSHPVGVAADFLTSAWGQNAGNHVVAPAAAAVETVAARWLLDLLKLPAESSVGFVTGATVANFTCLAAARGEVLRQVGWDADAKGLFGAPEITGFATWAMLKHLGRDGIATLIDQCCASARLVADLLAREPGIAILNEVALNQLVIRLGADLPSEEGDTLTRKTIEKIQADGMIFAGGAKWRSRDVLRLSVTNFQTTSDEAQRAAQSIIAAFKSVRLG
ncbi:pyridoxal-dependent decarboxylase [Rhizobium ruizarguesonis]